MDKLVLRPRERPLSINTSSGHSPPRVPGLQLLFCKTRQGWTGQAGDIPQGLTGRRRGASCQRWQVLPGQEPGDVPGRASGACRGALRVLLCLVVICTLHTGRRPASPLLHSADHPQFQALSKLTQAGALFPEVSPTPILPHSSCVCLAVCSPSSPARRGPRSCFLPSPSIATLLLRTEAARSQREGRG